MCFFEINSYNSGLVWSGYDEHHFFVVGAKMSGNLSDFIIGLTANPIAMCDYYTRPQEFIDKINLDASQINALNSRDSSQINSLIQQELGVNKNSVLTIGIVISITFDADVKGSRFN